jgi:tetratricopeptide (TPR) repeat protein
MSDNQPSSDSSSQAGIRQEMPADVQEFPELRDLVSPSFMFRQLWEFLECWFFSRTVSQLLIGLPFLIVVIGGSAYIWWLRGAPKDDIVATYEQAVTKAMKEERSEDARLLLRSLLQQRPYDDRYRYQLAMYLLEQDNAPAALALIQQMTAIDKRGFVPARLWLATQATEAEPVVKVSNELALQQLLKAIEEDSDHAEAHRMLAGTYMRMQQLHQAEHHLIIAAEQKPDLSLLLAKLQTQLGRSEEQIAAHLNTAAKIFKEQMLANPLDPAARIGWAEILMIQKKTEEAAGVLAEGVKLSDSEELRLALSRLFTTTAAQRLQESALNRDLAANLVRKAITVHPGNPAVIQLVVNLSDLGIKFTKDDLDLLVQMWTRRVEQPESSAQDRLVLTQLLASSGQMDEAIQQMTSLVDQDPAFRIMLARLYVMAERQDEATPLLTTLLEEQQKALETQPEDTAVLNQYAETLILAQRYSDAREAVSTQLTKNTDETQATRLKAHFIRATLAMYDAVDNGGATNDQDSSSQLELLQQIMQIDPKNGAVLQRLAKLSCSEDASASAADEMLVKIMASGVPSASLYNYVGTCALETRQFAKARTYLERAYSQQQTNPMVLNNLALALVRESVDNADRALQLCEQALGLLPDNPDVLSTRAEILMAQKKWEEARTDLETALPSRPTSRNTRELLAQVYDALNEPAVAAEHRRILMELE